MWPLAPDIPALAVPNMSSPLDVGLVPVRKTMVPPDTSGSSVEPASM